MKAALLIVGCLMAVLALSNVAQSKAIAEVETHEVEKADVPVEVAIVDMLRDFAVRAVENDNAVEAAATKTFDIKKLIDQARRIAEVVEIVRTRDVNAGLELLKKIVKELFSRSAETQL